MSLNEYEPQALRVARHRAINHGTITLCGFPFRHLTQKG